MSVEQVTYNCPEGATMGRNAAELISFYGVAPIAQRTSSIQASSFISVSTNATIGATLAAFLAEVATTLTNLGLWKGA